MLHKHYRQLVARGAHVRAGMLYKIATAQIYDGSRACEHDPDAQVACALCGSLDGSMFHRVYDCPCIPASFELGKTDRIVDEAKTRLHSCPIFWFRGLPPRGWYPELPVADDPFVEDFGSFHILGGHVFTDGSGRAEIKDPRLRRCGYGVAWIYSDGGLLNTLGGRAGILHGRIQSVARAELLAAVEALRLCRSATQQVFIWTDCMFVVNGFARGRRRKYLTHADLWEEFWRGHDASAISLVPQSLEKSCHSGGDRRRTDSFHHLKRTVMKLQTNLSREEVCGTPFPWNMLLQPAIRTAACDLSNQADRDQPDARPEQDQNRSC